MAGRAPRRPFAADARDPGGRFAIAAARFHEGISKRLVDGALTAFATHGVSAERVDVTWVPGSFELPQAAQILARTGRYRGVVCLGVVIRGETPHFEHVSRTAAAGIGAVALATEIPVTFGLITALTEEQAWARAGGAVGNRGEEAATAAVEMAAFARRARGPRKRPR
ncbi:MAG: 6,7-dimethyl-8-ribityllumazine synthase [Candidatus Rokubacteria bacterium]|nr:6,7-dimethyl-8-ribityllumazine synthase [Candidatus Rokubacteria bacterium]